MLSMRTFIQKHDVVLDLLLLSSLWILAMIIVNPYGDFPLNDDWSYGKTIKHLVEDGVFRPTGWTTMPLVTQALWGTLFCLPLGFSFTALRFSTLSLALIGILGGYLLLKQAGTPRYLAFAVALILAANPIYFALSNTFMTDAPFTTFTILTLFFLIRSLQDQSDTNLVFGAFLVATAILCRQLGLFLAVVFAPVYLLKNGVSFSTLIRAGLPMIIGLGVLLGFENWLDASAGLPALYGSKTDILLNRIVENPLAVLLTMLENGLKTLIYMGLFLLPLMTLLPVPFKRKKALLSGIILIFTTVAVLVISLQGRLMPLSRNILIGGGVGPVTLRDVYILELPHAPTLPLAFWLLVTGLGILGGGLILAYIVSIATNIFTAQGNFKDNNDRLITTFLLGAAIIYSLPIIAIDDFFDRYMLPLTPILCMVIAIPAKTVLRQRFVFTAVAALVIFLYALFSIAATRDYLTWNRMRWEALRTLVENDHISPARIDGGFEFNGWYLYDPDYAPTSQKSWWWVHGNDYIVTMGPIDGYEIVRQYSFQRWLPPQKSNIFVLRRANRL